MSTPTTEEDLSTLSDLVPLLAKKIEDAHAAAESLEAAATTLQHEVDEARNEAASRLAALQDALPGLVVQVEVEEKALKEADAALLEAWHEAAPKLARSGEAIVTQAHDVVTHAQELRTALAEAGTKIDQTQALGEAALAKLAQDAQEAEKRVEAALHTLEAEIEGFKQSTHAVGDAISSAARDLLAVLTEATGHADSALAEALDDMEAKATAHTQAAHDLFEALSSDLMDKVDAAGQELEHDVTTSLTEAGTHLRGDLTVLGATAGEQEKELEQHAHALEAALTSVKAEAEVVPAGVAEINEAAQRMGL
jgi:hypothetical protein